MGKLKNKDFMKKTKKFLSTLMVTALVVVSAVPTAQAEAAAKPALNKKKVSIQVGKKYTLKVVNKIKGSKYTWKTNKKKIATVTKKGVVKGKKKGKAVITCTVKAPAKTYKLTANVTVKKAASKTKPTTTPQVNTTATVSTQSELEAALNNANIKTVLLKTEAEGKFTIPAGTYSTKTLTVNAPNSDVTNAGVFKEINVQAIKASTWTENAKGNILNVSDTSVGLVVSANAQVKEIIFSGINASVNLKAEGIISKLVFNKKAKIEVTGSAKEAIPVEIASDAKDTEVISAVPVQVSLNATATITLNKGAENSKVEKKTESVTVKVENKTTVTITITTPGGTVTVSAGSTTTSEGKNSTTTSTPGPSASSGSNNGNSSAEDTTTPTTAPTTTPTETPSTEPSVDVATTGAGIIVKDKEIAVSGSAVELEMTIETKNAKGYKINLTYSSTYGITKTKGEGLTTIASDAEDVTFAFTIDSSKLQANQSKISFKFDKPNNSELRTDTFYIIKQTESGDSGDVTPPDGDGDTPTPVPEKLSVNFGDTALTTSSAVTQEVTVTSGGSVELTVTGKIPVASGSSIKVGTATGNAVVQLNDASQEIKNNNGDFTETIKLTVDKSKLTNNATEHSIKLIYDGQVIAYIGFKK